jgi:fermentation-respiration switch protein FrsA (DUF1100 family)
MLKMLVRIMLLLVFSGYVGLCLLALKADRIIFQPHRSSYGPHDLTTSAFATGAQTVTLTSGEEKIAAVYLPNPAARYTLLFSHGNAEDIGDDLPMLEEFRQAGFAVFAYDYRGYGLSTGKASEKGLYQDVDAAYDYVTGKLAIPADRVISFGRSLGCAAAIHTASTRPVGGLIVESPFLSAFRVLTRVRVLPWDKFDNQAKIRNVHAPVLVMHGRADNVVPFWHGERLYAMANEPKQFLWSDNAGHNDMCLSQRYFPAIARFAQTISTSASVSRSNGS